MIHNYAVSEFMPTLVLIIPEHHELDPQAVDDLWHHLRTAHGAELSIVRSPARRDCVLPLYSGPWRWDGPVPLHQELWERIRRTSFTLDWLTGVR